MHIQKFVATAVFTIAATVLTGGTSYAAPAPETATVTELAGVDQGVHYAINRDDATKTVTATITDGTFLLTEAGVQVINAAGAVTSTMPMAIDDGTNAVVLQPKITDNGTKLTAEPIWSPYMTCSPSSPASAASKPA